MTASRNADYRILFLLPGVLALVLGSLGLFGWVFDFPVLTRIDPDWNPMVPITALCFVLSGLSLLIEHKLVAPIGMARARPAGLAGAAAGRRQSDRTGIRPAHSASNSCCPP